MLASYWFTNFKNILLSSHVKSWNRRFFNKSCTKFFIIQLPLNPNISRISNFYCQFHFYHARHSFGEIFRQFLTFSSFSMLPDSFVFESKLVHRLLCFWRIQNSGNSILFCLYFWTLMQLPMKCDGFAGFDAFAENTQSYHNSTLFQKRRGVITTIFFGLNEQ